MHVWLQIQGSHVRSRPGEIDHEIISVILLPSADAFKKGCCQVHRKYVHKLLINRLFKPAQEKVWLGELTVPQWP